MEPYNQTTDLFAEQPVQYAGFWQRFGAMFIDALILGFVGFLLGLAFPKQDPESLEFVDLLSIVIAWLYYALQESGPGQATLGKKALGLKVTSMDGGRISFGQATGRYFGKIISAIILLIGFIKMVWDKQKQTLHDQMAGTLVVALPE